MISRTLGRNMESEVEVVRGKVGADCMVFSLPAAVKFADKWMSTHRKSRE